MQHLSVIATSVVRASQKGESHGGIYLVDLIAGTSKIILDWEEMNIDWSGRGLDRGLRGIAFNKGKTYIAASDEIFVFDTDFKIIKTWKNPYLKHCHEIFSDGDILWITSTGYDSIIGFDMKHERFTKAFCLRYNLFDKIRKKLFKELLPNLSCFDPSRSNGPEQADTLHINCVSVHDNNLYFSGTRLNSLIRYDGHRIFRFASIPMSTHNVRPYKGGILFHYTKKDKILHMDLNGHVLEDWILPTYDENDIMNIDLPDKYARQRFGRGLCTIDNGFIIAGSSPATVSLYRHNKKDPIMSVNISMDVRNAVHGLEVYPY